MDTTQRIQVETDNHYRVPIQVYRASGAAREVTLVILPALGIAAKFYARLALSLSEQGFDVVVME